MPPPQQHLHAQPQKLGRRASIAVGLLQQSQSSDIAQQRARRQAMAAGLRLHTQPESSIGRLCSTIHIEYS